MNEDGSVPSFTTGCPFQTQNHWGKKNTFKFWKRQSLVGLACKSAAFLRKMLRKINLPLTSQSGYQSQPRYSKTGNLRLAKEKIAT